MTSKAAANVKEITLGEGFADVVGTLHADGRALDFSSIEKDLILVMPGGHKVQVAAPSPLKPENAMVSIGVVQMNKTSSWLADLPDRAKAEFFVSPKATANLCSYPSRMEDNWSTDIESIRGIEARHGLHFNGQVLTGMQIFDKGRGTYEKAWATEVRAAWKRANETNRTVMTDLAMGTHQLICGREIDSSNTTVPNNLLSRVEDFNAAVARQGGEGIPTSLCVFTPWQPSTRQHMSTEHPGKDREPHFIVPFADFKDGHVEWVSKDVGRCSSRAMALHVLPS